MREVPSMLFGYMREMIEQAGLDARGALEGLNLARRRPRFGTRVDWDEVATFLNRATAGLSDDEMDAVGETYVRVNRYISALLHVVTRPTVMYRLGWLTSRHAFPHIAFTVEQRKGSDLTLTMTLPPEFQGSRFFFRGTVGELRAIPRLLRLPDAEVDADVSTHHGTYRVRLTAPERSWMQRGEDGDEELLVEDLLGLLPPQREAAGVSPGVMQALQERHGLTRAEARVALRLAEGLSVPAIARDLNVTVETIRTHLKRTYGKTGARRQAELVRVVLGLGQDA